MSYSTIRARCRHGAHWIRPLDLPSGRFWEDENMITVCVKEQLAARPAVCGSLVPHGPHALPGSGDEVALVPFCGGTSDGSPPVFHEPLPAPRTTP